VPVQTHDLDFHSCDLFCVQLFELEVVVVVLLILVELLTIMHLLNFLLIIYHMLIILIYLTKLKFVDIVCPLSFFLLKEMLQERSMVCLQKVPSFHYNPTFNMWRTRNYIYLLSPKQFPYGIVVFWLIKSRNKKYFLKPMGLWNKNLQEFIYDHQSIKKLICSDILNIP